MSITFWLTVIDVKTRVHRSLAHHKWRVNVSEYDWSAQQVICYVPEMENTITATQAKAEFLGLIDRVARGAWRDWACNCDQTRQGHGDDCACGRAG